MQSLMKLDRHYISPHHTNPIIIHHKQWCIRDHQMCPLWCLMNNINKCHQWGIWCNHLSHHNRISLWCHLLWIYLIPLIIWCNNKCYHLLWVRLHICLLLWNHNNTIINSSNLIITSQGRIRTSKSKDNNIQEMEIMVIMGMLLSKV